LELSSKGWRLMNVKIRKEVLSLNPYPAGKPISEVKREYGLGEK
jgi:hypothetical protein